MHTCGGLRRGWGRERCVNSKANANTTPEGNKMSHEAEDVINRRTYSAWLDPEHQRQAVRAGPAGVTTETGGRRSTGAGCRWDSGPAPRRPRREGTGSCVKLRPAGMEGRQAGARNRNTLGGCLLTDAAGNTEEVGCGLLRHRIFQLCPALKTKFQSLPWVLRG